MKAEGKGLSLEIQVDERIPARLLGDPIKIAQVLTNLLSNAIKFTERGAVILTVEAGGAPAEGTVLAFCVRDTGIGIAAEQLPHIFDGFAQASYDIGLKYGGTGLGLAISKKLVELLGGRLAVESEPGHGTAFTFQLRLKTAPPIPRS